MHAIVPKMFFPIAGLPEGPPDLTGYPAIKPGMTQLVSVKGITDSGLSADEINGGPGLAHGHSCIAGQQVAHGHSCIAGQQVAHGHSCIAGQQEGPVQSCQAAGAVGLPTQLVKAKNGPPAATLALLLPCYRGGCACSW